VTTPVQLDEVDRALIAALIADGRATYAALAPIVGLSQAAVRARVQRLLDERIITVTGRVDPAALGLGIFGFAFIEAGGEVDKLAARVGELDEVVFVTIGLGRFELLAELRCSDSERLLDVLDEIRVLDGVRRLQTVTVLHYEKQDWTSVGDRAAGPTPAPTVGKGLELDDIDRQLLRVLMADGRATYAALAPVVGLSQAAVRDRVLDLLDSNVITIAAHPVPEAMGIGGFAGLAIKASGPVGPVVSALVKRPEATLVARTLGRFDVVSEVWFDDNDHLADMLESLRAVPGVGSIDTLPYVRITKEEFGSGSS